MSSMLADTVSRAQEHALGGVDQQLPALGSAI
jgi:hypothetical protein